MNDSDIADKRKGEWIARQIKARAERIGLSTSADIHTLTDSFRDNSSKVKGRQGAAARR